MTARTVSHVPDRRTGPISRCDGCGRPSSRLYYRTEADELLCRGCDERPAAECDCCGSSCPTARPVADAGAPIVARLAVVCDRCRSWADRLGWPFSWVASSMRQGILGVGRR